MSDEETDWDSLCKQCGRCCFEKIEDDRGNILYTQTACRFLDIISRECKIFERRFEINPSCIKLTPELVQTLHWLPRDCGYHSKKVKPAKAGRKNRKQVNG